MIELISLSLYNQKILGIKVENSLEETVAANTFGSIIHNTLEDFYKPLVGALLTIDAIKGLKSQIEQTVTYHFKNEYKEGDITKGKNLIIFEIAKRYVSNFLDSEMKSLRAGDKIKIIAIESDNTISIKISELNFPIKIKGKNFLITIKTKKVYNQSNGAVIKSTQKIKNASSFINPPRSFNAPLPNSSLRQLLPVMAL